MPIAVLLEAGAIGAGAPIIGGPAKAYTYALGGAMRGGTSRGNVTTSKTFIQISGAVFGWQFSSGYSFRNLVIHDILNEVPNTCTFEGSRVR